MERTDYFAIPSNANFLSYLVNDYQLFLLAFLLLVACYIYQKRYLKLGFILSFFFGYLLLINVSYSGLSEQFYIESLYLPLSIFLIFPLVFDHSPRLKSNHLWIGLSVVLCIRLAQRYTAHQTFTERVTYLENYSKKIDALPHQKLIFDESKISKDTLLGMTWATSYEFWLLSTAKTGKSQSVIFLKNPEELRWITPKNNVFLSKWGNFEYNQFTSPYFNFQDTTQYKIIK